MWIVSKVTPFRRINGRFGALCIPFNGFSSMAESPELPDWVKFPNGEQSCVVDSEDDFVLPTKLDTLEDRAGKWEFRDRGTIARISSQEIVYGDVDDISEALNKRFVSSDAVIPALDSLSVTVSKDAVDKILMRFSNDWIPAFGFFNWAKDRLGYGHSPGSFDLMVDILGKAKRFDKMWELVEEMVRLGGLVSLSTMAKVMRRLAGAGRWGDAIRTFHDIERFGVKQDTLAMNVLLDTLCKERSVKRARDAFVELRNRIPPDVSSFNSLINGWCQARKVEEAWRTLEEMREYGFEPCVISYTSLIEGYCMEKNFQKVDAILDEMRARLCAPNVVTYTIIMHSLGKAKETQEAFKVLDKMKRDGCTPDTSFYNSLIYILAKVGRLRDANDVYGEMCKSGVSPNVTTFNTMISAACSHSQEGYALRLLRRMEESSCKPDIKTYSPLLKLCCKRRWTKILLYLLADMLKKDVSIDFGTYTLLIQGLCRNGKLEHSCLFFEEMVLKGFIPKYHTYNILLEALERTNMDRAKAKVQCLMPQVQL